MKHITLYFLPTNGHLDGRFITARGLHGLLFDVLQKEDQAKATWLHHHESPKPFSLAPIYSEDGILAGLRLAAINKQVADFFAKAWEKIYANRVELRLGRYQTFLVKEINTEPGPGFPALTMCHPNTKMALRFLSPTSFMQGPGHLLFPLPANVFGWPFRVWHAFAPEELSLPEDWLAWCEQEIFAVAHHIETIQVPINQSNTFTGFVGDVLFEAHDGSELYLRVWQALGMLATFCGVGHKTTMGMGAVEMIEPE